MSSWPHCQVEFRYEHRWFPCFLSSLFLKILPQLFFSRCKCGYMGASETLGKSVGEDTLVMNRHPIQSRVVILLVASSVRIARVSCVSSAPLPTLPLYYQLVRQQTSASPLQCLIWVYCSQIYELCGRAKKKVVKFIFY